MRAPLKHYLLASDFDQTLSFKDSGIVLAEMLGISGFEERVAGLARSNLVQQGGELAYLIRHDPEFRSVRREHLQEAGRRIRLKHAIPALVDFMTRGTAGCRFEFFVISAAPREIVISALDGIVPADHIYGTELEFDAHSGEVRSIQRVPAGYGKVAVIEELEHRLRIAAGSDDLRGRRQLRRARDAAREQPRRFHHRRVREPAARADRKEHGAQRQRVQHPGADSSIRSSTGRPRRIRDLFESYGLTPERLGAGAHGPRADQRDAR